MPLADCYAASGELLRAAEVYRRVADEKPARYWMRADYNAAKTARQKAEKVEARVPTLRFQIPPGLDAVDLEVDGKHVEDLAADLRVAPDVEVAISAQAKGRRDFREAVVLHEGERRVVVLDLALSSKPPPRPAPALPGARPRAGSASGTTAPSSPGS